MTFQVSVKMLRLQATSQTNVMEWSYTGSFAVLQPRHVGCAAGLTARSRPAGLSLLWVKTSFRLAAHGRRVSFVPSLISTVSLAQHQAQDTQ